MRAAAAVLAAALAAGCPSPVCETLASRCDGQRAEVCAADGQWQLIADCGELEGAMCAEVEDDGQRLHACVPTSGGEAP